MPGPNRDFLKGAYEAMRTRAQGIADQMKPGVGATELDSDDFETVWNRRAMSLEEEWELWRQRQPDGVTPLYSPEQIGTMVFKDREKLIKSGGRVEPKEWISFANTAAKRMRAKREAREAMSPVPLEGGATDGMV
jgi:hypothetical protein